MSKELEAARALVKMLEEKEKADNKVQLSSLNPGEIFKIGKHDFIVLEQLPEQTMVISKGFMGEKRIFDGNTSNYNNSSLKILVESNIQPIIENEVGTDNLVEHEVELTSVDMQNEFGNCRCKVRPITFDEARKYNDLLVNNELGDWWWTCTPWSTEERGCEYSIAVVSSSGYIRGNCCDYGCGVRPFCILKSNIFVSKRVAELEKQMKEITGKGIHISKSLGIGDTFELAGLTWKLLDITDQGYMCLADRLDQKMVFDSDCNNWVASDLKYYLNTDFYEKLSSEIGEDNIIPFERDLLSLDGLTEYGICEDRVSLLTVDEYRRYRNLIPNTDSWWWLVTPWSTPCNDYKTSVAVVSSSGYFNNYYCGNVSGVRPVCIFSAAIFESGFVR